MKHIQPGRMSPGIKIKHWTAQVIEHISGRLLCNMISSAVSFVFHLFSHGHNNDKQPAKYSECPHIKKSLCYVRKTSQTICHCYYRWFLYYSVMQFCVWFVQVVLPYPSGQVDRCNQCQTLCCRFLSLVSNVLRKRSLDLPTALILVSTSEQKVASSTCNLV